MSTFSCALSFRRNSGLRDSLFGFPRRGVCDPPDLKAATNFHANPLQYFTASYLCVFLRAGAAQPLTSAGDPLKERAYPMSGAVAGTSRAQMAELVDAPASGAGARKGVEVRVLFWAPFVLFRTSQKVYKNRRNPGELALGWFRIVPAVPGGS